MPYSDDCNHDVSEEDMVQYSVEQSMSVAESCENEVIPSEDSDVRNVEVKSYHIKKFRQLSEDLKMYCITQGLPRGRF